MGESKSASTFYQYAAKGRKGRGRQYKDGKEEEDNIKDGGEEEEDSIKGGKEEVNRIKDREKEEDSIKIGRKMTVKRIGRNRKIA
jgi:hypothetical protein